MKPSNNGHKKQSKVYPSIATIKYRNSPNSAITLDGKEVRREEKIWYSEYDDEGYPINGRFIACAPDNAHFVYIDPMWKKIVGRWFALCSCGSVAVIVGYNAYKQESSPSVEGTNKGELLICKWFLDNGVHQTGGRRWE